MMFREPLVKPRVPDSGRLGEFLHMQRQETGSEMFYKLQLKFTMWNLCADGSYELLQDACLLFLLSPREVLVRG